MIRRISSGGVYEEKVGYCRAVVAGGFVHIAGTVAQGVDIPTSAVDQCANILTFLDSALKQAGSDMTKVVRVVYYFSDVKDFEPCWPQLRQAFGKNPPAATMIECGLADPRYKIEIEITALA